MRITFLYLLGCMACSCNTNNVQEDMERYCKCLEDNKTNQEGREDCLILMEDIVQKYEYNPEALQEILKASENCH